MKTDVIALAIAGAITFALIVGSAVALGVIMETLGGLM